MFGVPWEGENIQPPDVRLFTTTAYGNTHLVCSTTSTSNSPWLISLCQYDRVVPSLGLHLCKLISTFKGNSTLQNKALAATNTITNTFYKNNPESIPAAHNLADEVFGKKWEELVWVYTNTNQSKCKSGGSAIVTSKQPGISNNLYVVNVTDQDKGSGHTMSHNRRSHAPWSTQVDLMDCYPEHHFVASSAQ